MIKVNFEQVLIVDIEALCWTKEEQSETNKAEIIEVGICSMDTFNGDILKQESYLIKPKGKISNYCETLTGITQKQINSKGMMFEHAMNKLRKDFGSTNKTICVFGISDVDCLKKACKENKAKYPFSSNNIDIALLFHLKHNLKKNTGLVDCLKLIGEEFEGRQHSGLNDALNTAKLLWSVIK